jgi:hypothetical protein
MHNQEIICLFGTWRLFGVLTRQDQILRDIKQLKILKYNFIDMHFNITENTRIFYQFWSVRSVTAPRFSICLLLTPPYKLCLWASVDFAGTCNILFDHNWSSGSQVMKWHSIKITFDLLSLKHKIYGENIS